MKETSRLQLELPKGAMERLKMLKAKTEAVSYAEVVRQALKSYEETILASESARTE